MISLTSEEVALILAGKKTQIRIPLKSGDPLRMVTSGWKEGTVLKGLEPFAIDHSRRREYVATEVCYEQNPRIGRRHTDRPTSVEVERMEHLDPSTELEHHSFGWPIQYHSAALMPRWASRIRIEVVGLREGRLHDISREDVRAEGIGLPPSPRFAPDSVASELHKEFRDYWILHEMSSPSP